MICATISYHITLRGEQGENLFIRAIEFKCLSISNGLWRRSQNERILRHSFRGSKSESASVQEVGEIQ